MPRTPRVVLPDHSHHIVQRGQLTGSHRFVEDVEKKIGRRIKYQG